MTTAVKLPKDMLWRGIESAGGYLESIDRTNLYELSEEQFDTFLCKAVAGIYPTTPFDADWSVRGIHEARSAAGTYIEGTGKVDLIQFHPLQFERLIEIIVTTWIEHSIPF
ncbi:hypothetical protein ABMY26_07040 (plasmid) [Azospirillum sp. HJ39]|uniref:hypothetical protein n=1 Tax=Azospirillum sp. HJ39 TaxID=3159496 RepID=UPI003556F923